MSRDPAPIAALKQFARTDVSWLDEGDDIVREMASSGDRAAIILAVSHTDDALGAMLVRRFRPELTKTELNALLTGDAPLATFSSRIRLGYALGVFGRHTRDDLVALQAIRNAFAHCRRPISFATAEVAAVVNRLHVIDTLTDTDPFDPWSQPRPNVPARIVCIRAALMLEIRLKAEGDYTADQRATFLP